jgi:phosphomannomutase/phosphoglucomutase
MSISQTIFRQYDVRGIVGRDLTEEVAYGLGRGYAAYLVTKGIRGAVAVGRDNRPSGDALRNALVRGLTECGFDVVDIGVVPTPLLYWTLHHEDVVGGIQITGSHNPPEYNGFKMCVGTGSLHGAEIQKLYQLIVAAQFPSGNGAVKFVNVVDRYVSDMATRIGQIRRAMARPFASCTTAAMVPVRSWPSVDARAGVDGIGLFTESDGTFPNHHPTRRFPRTC